MGMGGGTDRPTNKSKKGAVSGLNDLNGQVFNLNGSAFKSAKIV